ncbi:MAG: sulfotransferase family protein, partial [Limisphaerales bacterium]
QLLIDKNPSPTARLPLWLRVFPELRVLIALRDPRDVVLSCYFQNIPLNATNVNFLSLERVARHYADLVDIWLAVRQWNGFAWLETRYEDMVAKFDTEAPRVTEFLGLSWHPEQARFYESSRQKQLYSPTYQDVTLPVYSRSVGRWKAYEKHLSSILPALEPYCREFGY